MDGAMENQKTSGNSTQQTTNTEGSSASFSKSLEGMLDNSTGAKPTTGDKAKGNDDTTSNTEAKAPAWTSQLSEDLRNNAEVMKQLEKFSKISDLASGYAELEGKIGKSLIQPGKDASEEERNAFYEKLGKPKDASGYSIQDKDAEFFRDVAFKNNLTDDQMKGVYEAFKGMGLAMQENAQARKVQQVKQLEEAMIKEYGDKYSEKVEIMNRGIQAYGGAALGNVLNQSGVLFTPEVVKLFIQLGEQSAEAGSTNKGTPGGNENYKSILNGGTMKFKGL